MSETSIPGETEISSEMRRSCPMCQGKGYVEESDSPNQSRAPGTNVSRSEMNLVKLKKPTALALPGIRSSMKWRRRREGRPGASSTGSKDSGGKGDARPIVSQDKLPEVEVSTSPESSGVGEEDLLPPSSLEIERPADLMQKAVLKLKSRDWEVLREGLEEAVQVVRCKGVCVEGLNRALLQALGAARARLLRTGIRAVREVFLHCGSTVQRPEFDEMVNLLLVRMADRNQAVTVDAMEALRAVMAKVPIKVGLRAIADKAPRHKNPCVREAVGTLLLEAVVRWGPGQIISPTGGSGCGGKEARKTLLSSSALLLDDPNLRVRGLAKQIFELLVGEPDFDDAFANDVEANLARKIEKQLILLRYNKTKI